MHTPACSVPVVVRVAYFDADADSFPDLNVVGSKVPRACLPIAEEAVR